MADFIINPTLIDKIEQLDIDSLTYADIRWHYATGRSYNTSTAHEKSYRYRSGVATNVGDIEESVWVDIAKRLIIRNGEMELYRQFLSWLRETEPYLKDRKEAELSALNAYTNRVMDSTTWVDFIAFNKKYRPEILAGVETITFHPPCCQKSSVMTKDLFEKSGGTRVYCPHCGRWSQINVRTANE